MGEVVIDEEYGFVPDLPLHDDGDHDNNQCRPTKSLEVIDLLSSSRRSVVDGFQIEQQNPHEDRLPISESRNVDGFRIEQQQQNTHEDWLPITESRNGNFYTCVFHLLSSGIGMQALFLPVAFSTLGWAWGTITLSVAFAWQLYTIWLLVQLHEVVPGIRYSRYIHLTIAAFGPRLGKLLALFPVMYLSGGSCVMLIINGGGTMRLFYHLICSGGATCEDKSLTGAEWFLVFTCMAIVMAQRPNLNSIAGYSFIGAVTGLCYCTLIWALSIAKGRLSDVSYGPREEPDSDMAGFSNVLIAIGIIVVAFRGHNLVLEIQGTLPSNPKKASKKPMWRGVTVSYALIAMSIFPLAIAGYWVYGNKVPADYMPKGGILTAFVRYHGHVTSKSVKGLIYMLIIINSLSSYQIYAMPVFDNLEMRYVSSKKRQCPWWVRTGLRIFFGGISYLVAVAFPFLGRLGALIGGITLPLTYVYPCFMWILIKKPRPNSIMRAINLILGCFGMVLAVLLILAASWNIHDQGVNANFFKP